VRGSLCDVVATYHPAAVLRAPDAVMREQMRQALIDDLRIAVGVIASQTTEGVSG
jgi:hypothetical protein